MTGLGVVDLDVIGLRALDLGKSRCSVSWLQADRISYRLLIL
jgi:hypothetical protein